MKNFKASKFPPGAASEEEPRTGNEESEKLDLMEKEDSRAKTYDLKESQTEQANTSEESVPPSPEAHPSREAEKFDLKAILYDMGKKYSRVKTSDLKESQTEQGNTSEESAPPPPEAHPSREAKKLALKAILYDMEKEDSRVNTSDLKESQTEQANTSEESAPPLPEAHPSREARKLALKAILYDMEEEDSRAKTSDLKDSQTEQANTSAHPRKRKQIDEHISVSPGGKKIKIAEAVSPPSRNIARITKSTVRTVKTPKPNEKDAPRRPLKMLWDGQNAVIPKHLSKELFFNHLRRNLKRLGFELKHIEFYELRVPKKFKSKPNSNPDLVQNKERLQITKHLVEETEGTREDVDAQIMYDLMAYSLQKEPSPPMAVLLAAGDTDYLHLIEDLRYLGAEIFVTAPSNTRASSKDILAKDYYINWDYLIKKPDGYSPIFQAYVSPAQRSLPCPTFDIYSGLVIWDVATCSVIPFSSMGTDDESGYRPQIEAFVQSISCGLHSVDAYYQESESTQQILDLRSNPAGINIHHIKYPNKKRSGKKRDKDMDYCDVKIAKAMYTWAFTKLPPAPLVLITADSRLAQVVAVLKRGGFKVLVATDTENSELVEAFGGAKSRQTN